MWPGVSPVDGACRRRQRSTDLPIVAMGAQPSHGEEVFGSTTGNDAYRGPADSERLWRAGEDLVLHVVTFS
jgi:hypothetical protein